MTKKAGPPLRILRAIRAIAVEAPMARPLGNQAQIRMVVICALLRIVTEGADTASRVPVT